MMVTSVPFGYAGRGLTLGMAPPSAQALEGGGARLAGGSWASVLDLTTSWRTLHLVDQTDLWACLGSRWTVCTQSPG